jgi:CCR4-NOT transcription complex subunit 1
MKASDLVLEYGYACTESNESFTTVLNQANALPLSPPAAAELMIALLQSREKGGKNSWNLQVVKSVIADNLSLGFSVKNLIQALDCNWEIRDLNDFYFFKELLSIFFKESPFFTFLHYPWNSKKGILSFISFWIQVENLRMDKPFNGTVIPNSRKIISSHFQDSFWNNLDLIAFLWEMGNSSQDAEKIVGSILTEASSSCPELIMLGFARLNWTNSSPFKDILQSLLLLFLQGHTSSGFVLPALWQSSPSLFTTGLLALYTSDPSSLSRILDLSQDLKILDQVLETESFNFSIDLAALASRREYLNLEKWLIDHIREKGLPFFLALLDFLRDKVNPSGRLEGKPPSVPLSIDVAGVFLRTLLHNKRYFSSINWLAY